MEIPSDTILVMYSGGTDSTLCAVIAAKKARKVLLVTYKRFGLFFLDNSNKNIARLRRRFSKTQFIHILVDIEREYRKISYEHFLSNIIRFGFMNNSICGLCKLGMHWKTLLLCKKFRITNVYEGAISTSKIFPSQNMKIMIQEVKELYKSNGIKYETPVYYQDTQKELFKEGLIATKKLKNTYKDCQPLCSQQILFSRFVNYYLSKYTFEEYEKRLQEFYKNKINYLRSQLI